MSSSINDGDVIDVAPALGLMQLEDASPVSANPDDSDDLIEFDHSDTGDDAGMSDGHSADNAAASGPGPATFDIMRFSHDFNNSENGIVERSHVQGGHEPDLIELEDDVEFGIDRYVG